MTLFSRLSRAACTVMLLTLPFAAEVFAQAPAAPKPAVTVVALQKRPFTTAMSFTGRVVAVDKVEIRARVQGFLEKQHFLEGQDVKAGDLLFSIEKDTLAALVAQRNADLEAAKAQAQNATTQLERAKELLPRQTISQAVYDDREAQLRVANAQVLQAQAALQQAQISLGYAEIKAPIDGRIGRATFQIGALVGPDSPALAVLVSQDPIHVTFPVSQRQILEVRQKLQERYESVQSAVIRLRLSDNSLYDQIGRIDFTDVSVDQSTDTLTVRAVFPNPKRLLVDGQYVRISAEEAKPTEVLAIPQRAVLNDQAGSYVFVVGADNKVQQKRVTLGPLDGPDVVVAQGLQEGDRVVVDGIQKIRPGVEVDAAALPPQPKG